MIRIATICALPFAVAGCVTPGQAPDTAASAETIDYSVTPCFGFCPSFRLSVAENGAGTYHGERFVQQKGDAAFTASQEEFEAFAERLHQHVRTDLWGYAPQEQLTNAALIKEEYRGIRPAPGYPACPDHSLKPILFDLLDAEANTGITLTESFAMYPTAAVSGFYFGHPQAEYFGVARVGRDQLEDYATRRNVDIATAERWLRPNQD